MFTRNIHFTQQTSEHTINVDNHHKIPNFCNDFEECQPLNVFPPFESDYHYALSEGRKKNTHEA